MTGTAELGPVTEAGDLTGLTIALVWPDEIFGDTQPLVPDGRLGIDVERPEPEADPGIHEGSQSTEGGVGVFEGLHCLGPGRSAIVAP